MPNTTAYEPESIEHRMVVDPVGVVAEVIGSVSDPRDVIREMLSNSAAREVGATAISLSIYGHEKGLSFTVQDDGCGMDYTDDPKHPGRLDRFLNVAQGRQAGFSSDEFGYKGLGTILLFNSRRVVVETSPDSTRVYRVTIEDPKKSIEIDKVLPAPRVHKLRPEDVPELKGTGTRVTAYGYGGWQKLTGDFDPKNLYRYLQYWTVAGYTRDRPKDHPLPPIHLIADGKSTEVPIGFPYIGFFEPDKEVTVSSDGKVVAFGPKEFSASASSGRTVRISLKGSVTVDTGRYNLTDTTGGVRFSQNGIPYLDVNDYNVYGRIINLTPDWFRFVVESTDVKLNLSRSDFSHDELYDAFSEALDAGFRWVRETKEFQNFYANYRHKLSEDLQKFMNQKKEEFQSPTTQFVWLEKELLHAVPDSEWDTSAILWKLEGKGKTPFATFRTLQYAGRAKGVDLLVDFQEATDSELLHCVYVEIERYFSNFLKHRHDAKQMRCVVCWKVDGLRGAPGKLEQSPLKWKWHYHIGETVLPVYEIQNFPGIRIASRTGATLPP
jgi:hypothetical protein